MRYLSLAEALELSPQDYRGLVDSNHAFIDGNERIGHALMETFLVMDGFEISADVDEQERTVLEVAAGTRSRHGLTEWLRARARVTEPVCRGQ